MENDPYSSEWAQSTTHSQGIVALGKLILHGKRESEGIPPLAQETAANGCRWSREFHGAVQIKSSFLLRFRI